MTLLGTAVEVRGPGGELVGIENRRGRVVGGLGFAVMGLVLLTPVVGGAGPFVGGLFASLGLGMLFLAARLGRGLSLQVADSVLEVRHSIASRRRVPCRMVRSVVAEAGTEGLVYQRVYPVVLLHDGSRLVVSSVQWGTGHLDRARAACDELRVACVDRA